MANSDKQEKGFVGSEERLKRPGNEGREPRSTANAPRTNEDGTAFTVEERRQMLRNDWIQEALPTPPEIPGYHACWLSTTNSYDPIHKRIQMGYEPVRADEVPGFEAYRMKAGQWDGFIGCNEMVLFKVPVERFQDLMAIFHHDMPLEGEQAIKEQAMALLGKDRRAVEDEGDAGAVADSLEHLGRSVRAPFFTP